MLKADQQFFLYFIREIANHTADRKKLTEALKDVAEFYHVCAIEAELVGDVPVTGDQKELLLYQREEILPVGEPLKFVFEPDADHSIVIYVYAADEAFSESEKEELEMVAAGCRFVLEESRLVNNPSHETFTKVVTGLPNVEGYLVRVQELLNKGADLTGYSAFCFNLKGFGSINRRYGRKKGDDILKNYAGLLREFVKEDEALGHLGWDNFVALIKRNRQAEFITLLSDVKTVFDVDGKEETAHISATIGVWEVDQSVEDVEDLYTRPYIAMNMARNTLSKKIEFVSEKMIRTVTQRKNVLENYSDALSKQEFQVYYQPKVDSRTGKLVGAEGLVRWFRNGEMISPGLFIPSLEESDEILALDYYVLRHACRDMREWIKKGLSPVTVSVNFSRKDLKDPHLAENINRIIEDSGIDKKLIEVELTETVDEEEHGMLSGFINKLHNMDIMTAIDDFGSGYSSLATLREFRVHTLKIDRSFVNGDDFSWKDEIILRDVIHMAGELKMDVLCEGVERLDQLALLNSVGCYVIQGYFYDRPLPKAEFEERLKRGRYG